MQPSWFGLLFSGPACAVGPKLSTPPCHRKYKNHSNAGDYQSRDESSGELPWQLTQASYQPGHSKRRAPEEKERHANATPRQDE